MTKVKKISLMVFLFFTMLLMQNIVRNMKDSLIITFISPEIIGCIKLYGEIPLSIAFVIIYTLMCNRYNSEKVFRYVIIFFLLFFIFFSFYLLPNLPNLLPNEEVIKILCKDYPNIKWFIIAWGNWCLVIFYILGELLSIVLSALLFWQLANKINTSIEAKKSYPIYTFFGQINLIISSQIIHIILNHNKSIFQFSSVNIENIFQILTVILIICGVISIIIQHYVEKEYIVKNNIVGIRNNSKLTLLESIKIIISSKYLMYIFLLVLSYGICVILIEGLWFFKAKEKYPLMQDFMHYHATVMLWVGIGCMCFSILGKFILQYCSWFFCAIITPVIFITFGSLFFIMSHFQEKLDTIVNYQAISIVIFIGGLQNVIIKGSKYTLFDMSKEMSYIPLKEPIKTEGKAAVDLIGFKLGKALGASIPFFIFTLYPGYGYQDIIFPLLMFFILICLLWIYSVQNLSYNYESLTQNQST